MTQYTKNPTDDNATKFRCYEYADHKGNLWQSVIRPLHDELGYIIVEGMKPKGRDGWLHIGTCKRDTLAEAIGFCKFGVEVRTHSA